MKDECPLCSLAAHCDNVITSSGGLALKVACSRCGKYEMDQTACQRLKENRSEREPLAWIIRDKTLDDFSDFKITTQNVDDLVEEALSREPTPIGKGDLILEELRNRSHFFGHPVKLQSDVEWPRLKCRGAGELNAIVDKLVKNGLVEYVRSSEQIYTLTWEGWKQIESKPASSPKNVFVAMNFGAEMDQAYQAMKAVIEGLKLIPIRVDKQIFLEQVTDRILVDISRSQIVVADFTNHRGGVYFEAGYAMALGKKVVFLCHEDQAKQIHFDTRQYPHILWKTHQDLADQLRTKLQFLLLQKTA